MPMWMWCKHVLGSVWEKQCCSGLGVAFFFFFCKSERLYGSVIQGLRKKYELYELMLKYCFAGDKQLVQTNGFGTVAAFQRL